MSWLLQCPDPSQFAAPLCLISCVALAHSPALEPREANRGRATCARSATNLQGAPCLRYRTRPVYLDTEEIRTPQKCACLPALFLKTPALQNWIFPRSVQQLRCNHGGFVRNAARRFPWPATAKRPAASRPSPGHHRLGATAAWPCAAGCRPKQPSLNLAPPQLL